MKNIFYLTISLFYIGCTTPDTSESQLFIQAEEMAIESIAKGLEPYVEKVEYIPLETKPDALIQSPISGIIFYKDRIICTDRSLQQILLYDLKGNFVNKISSIGKGKGEFIQISAFTVNTIEDQLILYDGFTKKILRYKSNGDFIDESQLSLKQQPIGIYCAKMVHQPSTGFYYLYTAQQQTPETTKALGGNFDLIITDKYFNIISTQFPRNRIEHSLLVRRDHLQTDGEHVYFSNPLSNKIFKYAGAITPEPYIEIGCDLKKMEESISSLITSLQGNSRRKGIAEEFGNMVPFQDFIIGQKWSVITSKFYKEMLLINHISGKITRIKADGYNYEENSFGKDQLNIFIPFRPFFTPDSYFVAILDAQALNETKKIIKNTTKKEEKIRHIPEMEDTDNPVIILYKLKS